MKKGRIKRYRDYHPYHQLLGAAQMALESAEEEDPGYYYHQMIAITFSALAFESIVNSFGNHFIKNWNDFESARPKAKLRIVCDHFNIDPNFEEDPWSCVTWLMGFRNNIAHAKPEFIKFDKDMTETQFEKIKYEPPKSKIEKTISLPSAQRAVKSIEMIKEIFCDQLSENDWGNLLGDGFHGSSHTIMD